MILKFTQLTSIGKFRNYTPSGDVALKKLTLVYSDNGGGKTTLTSVIRSLASNDPTFIQKRKTIGVSAGQVAHVVTRNSATDTHHHFNGTVWSTMFPDIEVFDIHFINQNIYSGFEFNDEHRRHLHEFAIGAQSVSIQAQINQNKADKTACKQRQAVLTTQLVNAVRNGLAESQIPAFLIIGPAAAVGIDAMIAAAESALLHAQSTVVIQTLGTLNSLPRISHSLSLTGLSTDLTASSVTIQESALEQLFQDHCAELTANSFANPQSWLRLGYQYVISKKGPPPGLDSVSCPFCKQSVSLTSNILKTYAIKFDDLLNSLVARLHNHHSSIGSLNIESQITSLRNSLSRNTDLIASWAPFLPDSTVTPALDPAGLVDSLRDTTRALKDAVEANSAIRLQRSRLQRFNISLLQLTLSMLPSTRTIRSLAITIRCSPLQRQASSRWSRHKAPWSHLKGPSSVLTPLSMHCALCSPPNDDNCTYWRQLTPNLSVNRMLRLPCSLLHTRTR
jgi:wobble nucleotide-excising tRNase